MEKPTAIIAMSVALVCPIIERGGLSMSQHDDPYPADNDNEVSEWLKNYVYIEPTPAKVAEIRDAIRRLRAKRATRLSGQQTGGSNEALAS